VRDPAGILDSGSLWNFRYHCVKGSIRKPLKNRRWWRHLANNFALAEVPAGYDCFLVANAWFCVICQHVRRSAKRLQKVIQLTGVTGPRMNLPRSRSCTASKLPPVQPLGIGVRLAARRQQTVWSNVRSARASLTAARAVSKPIGRNTSPTVDVLWKKRRRQTPQL